jgi:LCP family protein required for cell wall assembly
MCERAVWNISRYHSLVYCTYVKIMVLIAFVLQSPAMLNDSGALADTQPTSAQERSPVSERHGRRGGCRRGGCLFGCVPLLALVGLSICFLLTAGLSFPTRTNILLLGLDRAPEGSDIARSDTMILTTVIPHQPYVGMLSIPRDLWVSIPGFGENRVNAAHFFAESEVPGSGPSAAMTTVQSNFGVDVDHYVRIRFSGLRDFVDSLGGVPVSLEKPTGTLPAGDHLLDGEAALALVRDRKGSDDFFRMARTQQFLKAAMRRMMDPRTWPRLPIALVALWNAIDTDLPPWMWPRLMLALVRVGPEGIDSRTITREMVRGFTTETGAQVLAPDWAAINPVLMEMFGQ